MHYTSRSYGIGGENALIVAFYNCRTGFMTNPDANAALIRQFYDEMFNRGNVEFAERVHGSGYRYHNITLPGAPVNHATYMARNAGFAAAFPDRRVGVGHATGERRTRSAGRRPTR